MIRSIVSSGCDLDVRKPNLNGDAVIDLKELFDKGKDRVLAAMARAALAQLDVNSAKVTSRKTRSHIMSAELAGLDQLRKEVEQKVQVGPEDVVSSLSSPHVMWGLLSASKACRNWSLQYLQVKCIRP